MSDAAHLLIPYAACNDDGCRGSLEGLVLPHLERLLARLVPAEGIDGDDRTFSMPHERVVARECGLCGPDGQLPWAALEMAQGGRHPGAMAWAWITPCHWRVGTDHIVMTDPQQLQLDAEESKSLLAAMRPYFEQDGLQLEYQSVVRWLGGGELFGRLPAASLDRVAGRVIDSWIPRGDASRPLRRLQQEMQMLLYTHPVNEARAARGLLPVNSFWVSGSGALGAAGMPSRPAGLVMADQLRESSRMQDWRAWASAWQQLDQGQCARLQQAFDAGRQVALTLAGERRARTWRSAGSGWRHRLVNAFSRKRPFELLADL
jgi:hypothetical protein